MCDCIIKRKVISTKKAPEIDGPFSQGVVLKNIIFVSSCIGLEVDTKQLKQGSIIQQMEQALFNLNMILKGACSSLDQVFKISKEAIYIFIYEINDFNYV